MSAKNRSEQLRARALRQARGVRNYSRALGQFRGERARGGWARSPAQARRELSRRVLEQFLPELGREERLWVYRDYACRDQLVEGNLAELSAKALASAGSKAFRAVTRRLDRAVTLAGSLQEQFAAALQRAQVLKDNRAKLDASPVLRAAGIRLYVRWHLNESIDVHLDELGLETNTARVTQADAVKQFEDAGLEEFIEHARTEVGAGTVRLCLVEDRALLEYLQARGWSDEHEGACWRTPGDIPDTLSKRTPESRAERARLLASLLAQA